MGVTNKIRKGAQIGPSRLILRGELEKRGKGLMKEKHENSQRKARVKVNI